MYNNYKCIYWVLLLCLEAINASNQGTICSCMIFQPSCFILYFIFPMNLVVFYALFYNDVTTLLWRHSFFERSQWKLHSICKIVNKRHFVCENFLFLIFGIFMEKITINYENHVNCPVTLHLPPIPFGLPLGWVLLGTHLWHTWGYFFNT